MLRPIQKIFTALFCIFQTLAYAQNPGSYRSIDLDGVDDYVLIPDATAINPTSQITVEAWIKADSYGKSSFSNSIFCKHGWGSGNKGYVLRCGDKGMLSFNLADAGGNWVEAITGSVMQTGIWYHVAGTFDGSNIKVYVNGVLEATQAYVGTISASTGLDAKIGDIAYSSSGNRYFDGQIDEVRVWSKALTQTQIRDWMCRKVKPSHPAYSSLGAYYKLDEVSGTVAADSSSYANHGSLKNGPKSTLSGASIGDTSAYVYAGGEVSLQTKYGDVFTAEKFNSTPAYVHIYAFEQTTQQGVAKNVSGYIDSSHYFGIFHEENKALTFDINYNYNKYSKVQGIQECGLHMLSKSAGYQGTWNYTSCKLFDNGDSLVVSNQSRNEFLPAFFETDSNKLLTTGFFGPWLCANDSVLITASGNDSFNYEWYKDGQLMQGRTKNTAWANSAATYKVKMQRKGTSCSFSSADFIITDKRPHVTWNYNLQICQNADSVKLPDGSPTGGTFSGSGITQDVYFNPMLSGAGNQTIFYTYRDGSGCTNKAFSIIEVLDTALLQPNKVDGLCLNADSLELANVAPSGGTYSGTGVLSGYFYPSQAQTGIHPVFYKFTNAKGCKSQTEFGIEVYAPDSMSITLEDAVCADHQPINVQVYPTGGTIIHPAVVGNSFIPSFANTGINTVYYKINDSHNCPLIDSASILIVPVPEASIQSFGSLCDNDAEIALTGGAPKDSGTYWVNGTESNKFNPMSYGKGSYNIMYLIVNFYGCRDSAQTTLRVNASPNKPNVTVSNNILSSSANSGNQWYDKNGPISGATAKTYSPSTDGDYSVKVTNDSGCSKLSDVFQYKKLGTRHFAAIGVQVYPNPSASGLFQMTGLPREASLSIFNVEGKEIINYGAIANPATIDLSGYEKGIYFIHLTSDLGQFIERTALVP